MIFVSFSREKCAVSWLTVPPFFRLTSCKPTKSNLYLANFLATAVNYLDLYMLLTFQVPQLMSFSIDLFDPNTQSNSEAIMNVS